MMDMGGPKRPDGSVSSSDFWRKYPKVDRKELLTRICSMYLDCGDESYIAEALSKHYSVDLNQHMVRSLRMEAAVEADTMDSDEERKKWVYRYRNLTVNNLVKEYMFITRVPNFFEAKIELADELFYLAQKASKNRLWIAVNDALGRNNIPLDMVDELFEFRETFLRLRQVLTPVAKERKTDASLLLLEVADAVADGYKKNFGENSVKAAEFACEAFKLDRGAVTPADVKFLREYSRCMKFPDHTDSKSLVRLIEGADPFHKRSLVAEAQAGNLPNLNVGDLWQLIQELKNSIILPIDRLATMDEYVGRRLKSGQVDPVFRELKAVIELHMSMADANKLYTMTELLSLRVQGMPVEQIQKVLDTVNPLGTRDEVQHYFRSAIATSEQKKALAGLAARYMRRRFNVDWAG